jgi:hypothetical protein
VTRRPLRPGDRGPGLPPRLQVRLFVTASIAAFSIGALLWACSGGHNEGPSSTGETPSATASATPPVLDCSVPNEGCACPQLGQTVSCGKVVYKSESYVSCSVGQRTCQPNGTWGDCVGTQVVTLNSWQFQGVHLLGQPAAVSANNTCDPSLFQVTTVLGTADAAIDDGGITVLESGAITLTQSGASGVGCGDAAPPPLAVSPGTASLQITQMPLDGAPPSPNTVQFAANLSGCAGDGGVNAIWTQDQPGIATISSGGLLSLVYPYAGPIHVTAYAGTLSGTGTANVTVNVTDTGGVTDASALKTSFSTTCGVDAGGGG